MKATDLGTSYQILVLFTMTGAVLYSNNVAVQVDINTSAEGLLATRELLE